MRTDTPISSCKGKSRADDAVLENAAAGPNPKVDQHLASRVRHSPLAMIEFDCEGRCLSWNHKAEEIFGHHPEAEDCRPVSHLLTFVFPEDRADFEEVYRRVCGGADPAGFVSSRFIDPGGWVRFGEWFLSRHSGSRDGEHSIVCFVNDVTDREKTLAALNRSNEELQQTLISRTVILRKTAEELHAATETCRRLEAELAGLGAGNPRN